MNTNLNSPIPSPRTISGEGWAAVAGAIGSALLLAKKLVSPKASQARAGQPGRLLRRVMATRERITQTHLAILEKLDANHRELLAALNRQATRINALEAGLARVDERTRK